MHVERIKNLVSIVVSNYNNEKYIEECLDSLINQSYENIEIIIIDDCSTDNSVDIINSWINKINNYNKDKITFLKMPKNMGFSGAVTVGMYLAKGEYIAIQDGDDISHNKRIETQVKYLQDKNDIMMVGSNYSVFRNYIEEAKTVPNFVVYGKTKIEEEFGNGNSPVSFGTILFKGEVFDKVGGLTRKLEGAEDYEFIAKSLIYGINNINEPLYYYRSHKDQRSKQYYSKEAKKKDKIYKETLSVMLVLDKFNIGGTETHVLTLAKQLINEGIKVTVVGGYGPLDNEFRKLKCKIYNLNFPLEIERDENKKISFLDDINNIIEAEDINLIHAHQSSSGSLALEAGKNLGIPCIFTVHGMYYYDILNSALKQADTVISVSIPVYKWLLKYDINSVVVPNGISFRNYMNSQSDFLRSIYDMDQDSLGIIYCSRMAWGKIQVCKNLITVIRDLRKRDNIKYDGIIIGDGPGYLELKKFADSVNNELGQEVIHFTGSQIDVNKFYMAGDCVLGTGRVAIEAMAAFKKVIAAGNSGYYGFTTSENFKEAWSTYFGDHDYKFDNDPKYLYEDMKEYYLNKEYYDKDIYDLYDKSRVLFDIFKVTSELIDIYIDAFN